MTEQNDKTAEITIKFGKGLVGEPFTSKSGTELVRIDIPNRDPMDARPWESFLTTPNRVHENQFGKGVWMKLPEDGTTRLSRSVLQGQDINGKRLWKREYRTVPNTELKAMLEAYKEKNRDSVLSDLSSKQPAADKTAHTAPKRAARNKEASR
ncbi:MAG: hypothetical protein LUG44_11430 [Clostridiales bacterium]|nr:hypothetical protein [Clostridiales bacterium]